MQRHLELSDQSQKWYCVLVIEPCWGFEGTWGQNNRYIRTSYDNRGTEEQKYFWGKGNRKKSLVLGNSREQSHLFQGNKGICTPGRGSEIDYIYHISHSLFSETKSEDQEINLV